LGKTFRVQSYQICSPSIMKRTRFRSQQNCVQKRLQNQDWISNNLFLMLRFWKFLYKLLTKKGWRDFIWKKKKKYFSTCFSLCISFDICPQQSSDVQFLNIRNHSTHIADHGSNLQMKYISIRMFVTQPNMYIYLY
jgi:hypothetical protein